VAQVLAVVKFMQCVLELPRSASEGTMSVNEKPTQSASASAAVNGPWAFAIESKSMVNNTCSLLLGTTPELFFAEHGSQLQRMARCFKCNKGALGHCQDRSQGMLHHHLLFFGGLLPCILQTFHSVERTCKQTSEALDTMCCSLLPSETHLGCLVHKVARRCLDLDLDECKLKEAGLPPPLAR
jgi:hypothetical protein